MKALIGTCLNDCQTEFNSLCEKGGGVGGGPARGKVRDALRNAGQALNGTAYTEMEKHLTAYPEANPWHVCFAVSMIWGHLAKLDIEFTGAVVDLLANWNAADLKRARGLMLERGPEPIEQSLIGAHNLFSRVRLPSALPTTLRQLDQAQQRWFGHILSPDRPRYIGSWNATAMFMTALFARPALAATMREPRPLLPPGGPIFRGLQLLHQAHLITDAPDGSELDDGHFKSGVLAVNNALLVEVHSGHADWSLIDVHSGVYMLGTRHPHSGSWA